jgi:predicted regulator of Ras-like GTPase activity (Roadblock/LC7/MglB family)
MSLADKLQKLLTQCASNIGATACAIVSREGLIIQSTLPKDADAGLTAAIAASIAGISERAANTLLHSKFKQTIIETQEQTLIVKDIGEETILIAIAPREAKTGLILHEMEKASKQITETIK